MQFVFPLKWAQLGPCGLLPNDWFQNGELPKWCEKAGSLLAALLERGTTSSPMVLVRGCWSKLEPTSVEIGANFADFLQVFTFAPSFVGPPSVSSPFRPESMGRSADEQVGLFGCALVRWPIGSMHWMLPMQRSGLRAAC